MEQLRVDEDKGRENIGITSKIGQECSISTLVLLKAEQWSALIANLMHLNGSLSGVQD